MHKIVLTSGNLQVLYHLIRQETVIFPYTCGFVFVQGVLLIYVHQVNLHQSLNEKVQYSVCIVSEMWSVRDFYISQHCMFKFKPGVVFF